MDRSVEIAVSSGDAICLTIAAVAVMGVAHLAYSIIWQIIFNRRIRDAIVKHRQIGKARAYMLRQDSTRKQLKLATVDEEADQNSDSLAKDTMREQIRLQGQHLQEVSGDDLDAT